MRNVVRASQTVCLFPRYINRREGLWAHLRIHCSKLQSGCQGSPSLSPADAAPEIRSNGQMGHIWSGSTNINKIRERKIGMLSFNLKCIPYVHSMYNNFNQLLAEMVSMLVFFMLFKIRLFQNSVTRY